MNDGRHESNTGSEKGVLIEITGHGLIPPAGGMSHHGIGAHLIALKNNNPTGGQLKIADNILEKMFPNPLDYANLPTLRTNTPDDAPFTKEEIAIVIKNLYKRKAPGPDGIDNIILQQINKRFPILLMELFNKCLRLGTFPGPLKFFVPSSPK
ncbi:hypothetical protein AVEN_28648-1 [Araneus ventricosus]|uniref:Reverse transcriptase domain-containing protein n=1 Tax=Araneus ventricosus TaxID=182803 RepID=A0A4Y2FJ91_ARAVE|nr:hypothetical protein AVEN_28648-1 [Araneus ventricosus]